MKYKIRFADKEDYKVINEIIREVHDLHVKNRPDVYNETDKPLSEEEFNKLYSSGIFKELNCVCNVCIDDFESEIIDFSKLIMAKETIIKFKNSLPKDEFIKLYSLFLEAINYQTLIAFDF